MNQKLLQIVSEQIEYLSAQSKINLLSVDETRQLETLTKIGMLLASRSDKSLESDPELKAFDSDLLKEFLIKAS